MRSPLGAWRKLFAIGGAPAASHVTLSRAPSADRLLDPLANARVAHGTSLDALARPLDVGGLLTRVANAALTPETASAEADATPREKRTRRVVAPAAGPGVASSSAPGRSAAVSRTRTRATAQHPDAEPSSGRSPLVVPRPPGEHGAVQTPTSDASPAMARPGFGAHDNRVTETGPRVIAARAQDVPRSLLRSSSPLEVQHGSNARVVLSEPVAGVERLLAIGAPTATKMSTRPTPSSERATSKATAAMSKSSTPDVARLLAAAVERVGASSGATSPTSSEVQRSYMAKPQLASPAPEPTRGGGTPTTSDAEPVGGFRGLAQRTLQPANGARQVQVQRIEPETRTSSDLAFDNLDAKVADSLARVLEREARRHGIDLAEARS